MNSIPLYGRLAPPLWWFSRQSGGNCPVTQIGEVIYPHEPISGLPPQSPSAQPMGNFVKSVEYI